ncbi:MAG: nuclease [Leptolyngbyaceae cyanobacterium CSU_1_4]|nr:nuclease [Leptolyngbyaceae cyanobacterium CSU_1_4]
MSQAEVVPDPKSSIVQINGEKNAVASLKAIVEGLTWMSESDYPFEVVLLPDRAEPLTTDELLQRTGHDAETVVEEISIENFFAPAIQPQDWHEEADKQRLQHFQTLLQWIEQHLSSIKVYRVGSIAIDVYILGKTESGNWISLSTKVIET